MPQDDTLLRIVYENSGEENQIPLSDLVAALTGFLDHFAEKSLVGEPFFAIVRTGDGQTKLSRLLDACGYRDNPRGFFADLLVLLGKADGTAKISINGQHSSAGSGSGRHAEGYRYLPGKTFHAYHPANACIQGCGLSVPAVYPGTGCHRSH